MNTLLFLNSFEGSQMGIEDGFLHLETKNMIKKLKWFYYQDYNIKNGVIATRQKMLAICKEFQPQLIILFHIDQFQINKLFLTQLKEIDSKPIIVYDEGDMYGGWAKQISRSTKLVINYSDFISIRGLGDWSKSVKRINQNTIYIPHSNSLFRYTNSNILKEQRRKKIIFIGNKVTSILGNIRRLPGAKERECLVKSLDKNFSTSLEIYGKGWDSLKCNRGELEFSKQVEVCSENWFQVSYEHYPSVPYYFSDRLPIALSCGQIYICHYHSGYENIFKNTDFIYFFNTKREAFDIIQYLMSLDSDQLFKKSQNAVNWAKSNLCPTVVWNSLFSTVSK